MEKITLNNYYEDKIYVSNSMLNDFVRFTKTWKKYYTPDIYNTLHVENICRLEQTPAMKVWSIVDEYFADWVDVFNKYQVVDKRTKAWKELFTTNPELCITSDELNRITFLINALSNNKRFMDLFKEPTLNKQPLYTWKYEWTDSDWIVNSINIKWKFDFYLPEKNIVIDLKTTANITDRINEMQWDWIPDINHKYFRQLALYNYLTWKDNECWLCFVYDKDTYVSNTDKQIKMWMVKWIKIPKQILEKSLESIFEDLTNLKKYYDNWFTIDYEELNNQLFNLSEEEKDLI